MERVFEGIGPRDAHRRGFNVLSVSRWTWARSRQRPLSSRPSSVTLQDHSSLYEDVAKEGGRVALGIFLMVPSKEPRIVTLTPEALTVFLKFGITVHVTGFPYLQDPDELGCRKDEMQRRRRGPAGASRSRNPRAL